MSHSYIALGYDCNHNCICCPLTTFDRLHTPLKYTLIKEQIEVTCKTKEKHHFTISGGEPTINDDFFKVLRLLASYNTYITLLSNASSCEDRDFVKKIVDCFGSEEALSNFEYITAIHSYDPNIHDKITATPGSLWQTMKGLDNLVDYNVRVGIKHIMNKISCLDMGKTFNYLGNHFPKIVGFNFCSMDYAGRCGKNTSELFINFKDLQPYLEETLDIIEANSKNEGRQIAIFETPLCLTDPYYWKYYISNKNKSSVYVAPNAETPNNMVENVAPDCDCHHDLCQNCDVKQWCDGIWRTTNDIGKEDKQFLEPVKILKKKL